MILFIILLILIPPLFAAMLHIFASVIARGLLAFEGWLDGRKPKNEYEAFKEPQKPGVYIKFTN